MEKKMNIIKDLNKLFSLRTDDETTKINPENYKGYMDSANVCMLVPKSKEFEKILLDNFDVHDSKIPELSYVSNLESKSTFGTEYLLILLTLCKYYEKVQLSVKNDFPLRAETEDFIFILAPRVEN
jgi:hypothetical protein